MRSVLNWSIWVDESTRSILTSSKIWRFVPMSIVPNTTITCKTTISQLLFSFRSIRIPGGDPRKYARLSIDDVYETENIVDLLRDAVHFICENIERSIWFMCMCFWSVRSCGLCPWGSRPGLFRSGCQSISCGGRRLHFLSNATQRSGERTIEVRQPTCWSFSPGSLGLCWTSSIGSSSTIVRRLYRSNEWETAKFERRHVPCQSNDGLNSISDSQKDLFLMNKKKARSRLTTASELNEVEVIIVMDRWDRVDIATVSHWVDRSVFDFDEDRWFLRVDWPEHLHPSDWDRRWDRVDWAIVCRWVSAQHNTRESEYSTRERKLCWERPNVDRECDADRRRARTNIDFLRAILWHLRSRQ